MTDFDFGFTAVDEEELHPTTLALDEKANAEQRLDALYAAIMPLLTNLEKNPEKEYILWPDRLAKIGEFRDHLTKIVAG